MQMYLRNNVGFKNNNDDDAISEKKESGFPISLNEWYLD